MNPKVDWFFNKETAWQESYAELRTLALSCGLSEDLKWGCPCYSMGAGNIVLIHGFKEYCALLFMQGVLLKDPKGLLIQQTKNVQAARQLRFKNTEEVQQLKSTITSYIVDAIAMDKAGLKLELKKTDAFEMPAEFQTILNEMEDLKSAFYHLTPGRQRAYLLYFAAAKQSKTRETRIEKYIPKILDGKGLED